jgi:Lon protease-like protein
VTGNLQFKSFVKALVTSHYLGRAAMPSNPRQDIFIFPLNTVLFPDGLLPLKVFEQRYIDMTKECLRDGQPFGVCLIREGKEVGTAAVPEPIGSLARIAHWEMPQLGVFQLLAQGAERFRILETRVQPNQLVAASVETLPPDTGRERVDPACGSLLRAIIDKAGADRFPAPLRLDDATWVGFRLAEVLPLDAAERQQLLELTDAPERLARLKQLLMQQGLALSDPA